MRALVFLGILVSSMIYCLEASSADLIIDDTRTTLELANETHPDAVRFEKHYRKNRFMWAMGFACFGISSLTIVGA